jgi:hypothetical protein
MEELDLQTEQWDCCVVGNGVSALWLAHRLWSAHKSVVWITAEEPHSPSRAFLRHAWLWGVKPATAAGVMAEVSGFNAAGSAVDSMTSSDALAPFETVYYDARGTKRLRKLSETKHEWGEHEKEYFEHLIQLVAAANTPVAVTDDASAPQTEAPTGLLDFWNWHQRLYSFHEGDAPQGPAQIEIFKEPRFVRVQGWPIAEIGTENGKVISVALGGHKKGRNTVIRAGKFYFGDYEQPLAKLIKDETCSEQLGAALKGRTYRPGFGFQVRHKNLGSFPTQTVIVPLTVNPGENSASHVIGRFVNTDRGLESFWTGFLTDAEVEDNNEILKKIKQAKRAIERAIPGFTASVEREAVTFESRMWAQDLVKKRKLEALGAGLVSDVHGPEVAAEMLKRALGVTPEKRRTSQAMEAGV